MEQTALYVLAPSMAAVKTWGQQHGVNTSGLHYLHGEQGLRGIKNPMIFKLPGWDLHPMWQDPITTKMYHSRQPVEVDEKWVLNFLKSNEQPLPTEGQQSVTDELIELLRQRQAKEIATYGRSLQTFNGRSARRDALEKALDLNQYLMQMYLEEKAERERTAIELNNKRAMISRIENFYYGNGTLRERLDAIGIELDGKHIGG